MSVELVILGWDSATFDVIDPLIEDGRLPALASLIERGHRAAFHSTWPAMTDCAWTSAFTGRNPGAHGIFGSWYRAPGAYECRYFSARDRTVPALWEIADEARWLIWNVPMTYPPQRINGVMVAGYGAPPGARLSQPESFQDDLSARFDLDDLLDRAPHRTIEAFAEDLRRGLEVQARALPRAAVEAGAECIAAVWPHVDRAQHFFWRHRGTNHRLGHVIDDIYEAMDAATAAVIDAFPNADVVVVSDHGAGPLKGDLNLGAWLAGRGLAQARSQPQSLTTRAAWSAPPRLRKLGRRIAPGLARRVVKSTLAGQLGPFDWSRTKAFMGFQSDLWVNLAGREPQGIVHEEDASALLGELRHELLDLTDPRTGENVFAAVYGRDDIYSGDFAARAPDLMLDCWSAGYRVAPGREPARDFVTDPAPLAGVKESWSSDHRPEGIFIAAGPRIAKGRSRQFSIYDLTPTACALLGHGIPEGLDGRVLSEAVDAAYLRSHPVRVVPAAAQAHRPEGYSQDEAAAVATHLRDLGYIE